MSEHETPNKTHGILRGAFANSAARIAYVVTATDLAQGRVWRQTDTLRDYVAIATGAGSGSWRLIGSGDAGGIGGALGASDNRVLRSDGAGGATAQGSAVEIDDTGKVIGATVDDPTTALQIANRQYVLANAGNPSASQLETTLRAVDYVLVPQVRVAILAATLPAYTATVGSGPAAVLTANANGALPAGLLDGVTVAEGATIRVLLALNGSDPTQAGVYDFTNGGASSAFAFTPVAGLATAAALAGLSVKVGDGAVWAGAEFSLPRYEAGITLGTTPIVFEPTSLHGFAAGLVERIFEDYSHPAAAANITTGTIAGRGAFLYAYSGAGSVAAVNNGGTGDTLTERGFLTMTKGTTTTGLVNFAGRSERLSTLGKQRFAVKFRANNLHDASNIYTWQAGWSDNVTAGGDGLGIVVTVASGATTLEVRGKTGGVVQTLALPAISAATWYEVVLVSMSGSSSVSAYVNGILIGTLTGYATSVNITEYMEMKGGGSGGTTARTVDVDYICYEYYRPFGRR